MVLKVMAMDTVMDTAMGTGTGTVMDTIKRIKKFLGGNLIGYSRKDNLLLKSEVKINTVGPFKIG
jgi:hypothetical protein